MTVQQLSESINRYDAFLKATEPQFLEFQLWKLETDLETIHLNGRALNVQKLLFSDWVIWRLQNELEQSNIQDTIDIDFVYAEYQAIN